MWKKIKDFLSDGAGNTNELQAIEGYSVTLDNETLNERSVQAVIEEETRRGPQPVHPASGASERIYFASKEELDVMSVESIREEAMDASESSLANLGGRTTNISTEEVEEVDSSTTQSLPHRTRNSLPPDEDVHPGMTTASSSLLAQDGAAERHDTTERPVNDHITQHQGNGTKPSTADAGRESIVDHQADPETSLVSPKSKTKSMKRKRVQGAVLPTKSTVVAPVATHKRFDSEEPIAEPESLGLDTPNLSKDAISSEEEDQSEDDAPEEISGNKAAQEVKALAAKAAQSLKAQREIDRAKRQKRDSQLKSQSQRAKKRKLESSNEAVLPSNSLFQADALERSQELDDDLPYELPEEVLAMEYRLSEEPSNTTSGSGKILNKRKRLDQKSKPAKDIRIGNKNIRVLTSLNPGLPPTASHQMKNIKTTWLKTRGMEARTKVSGYRIKGGGARSFLRS